MIVKDPAEVSLGDKVSLLREYVDIIWSVPEITTSSISYGDGRRNRTFANSEGAFVQQQKIDVSMRISAMARNGGEVQQSSSSIGSNGDFSLAQDLHEEAKDIARKAVDLLKAPEAKGGEYTVVLDPILAGVFIHEAFGHLSEADHVYENPRLREIMVMGRRFGGSHLNVVDGARVPGLRGSYKYDDEGVPSTKTHLLREGVLTGRLHSRETAAALGEAPTGNARAISFLHPPIVRMTNTYIEPGTATLDEVLSDIKDGLYVSNWYGGMTSMEQFTFSAGEAHAIRNGRIEELMRPVLLSGNLFTTLENLDAIANDLEMNQGGGCGKGASLLCQCPTAALTFVSRNASSAGNAMTSFGNDGLDLDALLAKAGRVSEQAEVFYVRHRNEPVQFEANRLKMVETRESSGVALRIIKNGRIGFSSTSKLGDIDSLIEKALEVLSFGPEARLDFLQTTA